MSRAELIRQREMSEPEDLVSDPLGLLHELSVHQVELEMQNQELRRTRQELAESRARYADLYHEAPVAYFTLSRDGIIEEINGTALTLLGRRASWMLGKPLFVALRTDGKRALLDYLRACRISKRAQSTELRLELATGAASVQLTSVPVLDGSGTVTGFRSTFVDVTSLKRAEQAAAAARMLAERARERAAFLADVSATLAVAAACDVTAPRMARLSVPRFASWCIVESASLDDSRRELAVAYDETPGDQACAALDALEEAAADVSPDGVVSFCAAWPLLGQDALPPETSATRDTLLARVLEGVAPRSYLSVPISAGGRVFGRMLLGSEGTRPRFDETDLKVAEELGRIMGLTHVNARLVRDLKGAVTARDELLAFLSHDVRNVMLAVRKQAGQLRGQAVGEGVRDGLDDMGGCIDGALRFLGDILDLGRLDAGLFEAQAVPADIGAMVAEALAVNAASASVRGVRLEQAAVPQGELRCDRQRVIQVLVNLVDNAVKFSPAGGVVRVAVAAADGQVRFSVRDEGAGIAERDRPHLFERHYRGAASPERSGLGLGLFIARRIVEAHRGTVWVESPAGQGATFWFALPSAG